MAALVGRQSGRDPPPDRPPESGAPAPAVGVAPALQVTRVVDALENAPGHPFSLDRHGFLTRSVIPARPRIGSDSARVTTLRWNGWDPARLGSHPGCQFGEN